MTMVTDHKPLLGIYVKALSGTSAYNMKLMYEPGHRNPADYMSQHPNNIHDTDCRATIIADCLFVCLWD